MNPILDQYLDERKRQFMLKADLCLPDARLRELRSAISKGDPSEADAQQVLARHMLGGVWEQVREPATGTLCKVFFLGCKGEQFAVRIGRLRDEIIHWPMLCDRILQPTLRQARFQSPTVFAVDCSRLNFPFDFQITSIVPGELFSKSDDEDELICPKLDHLARSLARLHNIVGEGSGPLHLDATTNDFMLLRGLHESWWDYVCVRLDDHISICRAAGRVNDAEVDQIRSLFDREILDEPDCTSRLLHGDPGNHNLFFQEPHLVTFIDWEDSLLGDPVFDVAMWASFHPERRWKRFFAAYSEERRKTAEFRFRSDHFWLYYLRVALFKTAHRIRFGIPDRPDRISSSFRIQRALQALEGELR